MRDYLQHGRRHAAGGTDPIPGLGGELAVATLRDTAAISVAGDNAQHYLSLRDGAGASFQTNDSSVFDNASTTGFTGSAVYGLKILQSGFYKFEWSAVPTASGGAVRLDTYWSIYAPGTSYLSVFQQGRTAANLNDTWDLGQNGVHLFWTEYATFPDSSSVPAYAAPWAKLASSGPINLHINVIATRLGGFNFNKII